VEGRRRFKQPESGGRVIGYAITKTMGQLKLMKKPYKTLILLSACFALSSCSAANSSSKATGLITKITCQSSLASDDFYAAPEKTKWSDSRSFTTGEVYLVDFTFLCATDHNKDPNAEFDDIETRVFNSVFSSSLDSHFSFVGEIYRYASSAYLSGFYSCETHYRKSDNVIEQSPFSYFDEDSGVLKRYEYVFLVAPSKAGDLTITFSATPEYPDSLVVYGIGATPVDFVFNVA
jgi:hypothetical protein